MRRSRLALTITQWICVAPGSASVPLVIASLVNDSMSDHKTREPQQAGRLRSQGCALLLFTLLLLVPTLAQEAQTITPNKPIERDITGGQTHTYRLTLQAGQFIHFGVQQTSCDVALTLTAPDGKKLEANAERYLKPAQEMTRLFRDWPDSQRIERPVCAPPCRAGWPAPEGRNAITEPRRPVPTVEAVRRGRGRRRRLQQRLLHRRGVL